MNFGRWTAIPLKGPFVSQIPRVRMGTTKVLKISFPFASTVWSWMRHDIPWKVFGVITQLRILTFDPELHPYMPQCFQ